MAPARTSSREGLRRGVDRLRFLWPGSRSAIGSGAGCSGIRQGSDSWPDLIRKMMTAARRRASDGGMTP